MMAGLCCKYTAGMLTEVVEFQRQVRTSDGAGGYVLTWAPVSGAPTRAMVKPMSGRERWASARVEAIANYRMVVRYHDGLKEGDRVLIRDRPGQIKFAANVEMADRWLELDVELGAAT